MLPAGLMWSVVMLSPKIASSRAPVTSLAVIALAERVALQVGADRPGQGIGNHERRRGQVIGPHLGVDAALEIAVAGQDRGDREVALVDRVGNRLGQRSGIADAGGAAVA